MRRVLVSALAVLLLAAFAAPLASAGHNRGEKQAVPEEDAKALPSEVTSARKGSSTSGGGDGAFGVLARELGAVPTTIGLAVAAILGVLTLGVAFLAARRAFRPPAPKPPKKSFAAGRSKGVRDGIRGSEAALEALSRSGLGDLASVAPAGSGYRVTLRRRSGVPCAFAAGYLTGLFEAAWALDVHLEHPVCAGKEKGQACVYEAYPAPPSVPQRPVAAPGPTSSGRAEAAASTQG